MIKDYFEGLKKIVKQNSKSKILRAGKISYVNWWDDVPENIWFTRFINAHFGDDIPPIRFYSMFGNRNAVRAHYPGIKIFFYGENLDPFIFHNFQKLKKSGMLAWNDRLRKYGDKCLKDVDICIGFSNIESPKYIRFPLWILYMFNPNSNYNDIKNKFKEIENKRNKCINKKPIVISTHDDFGLRTAICDEIEANVSIAYAGKWRNNTSELWDYYDDDKIDMLNDYMFNICAENVDCPFYVTEKLFEAFSAGSIPIYCGACNSPEPDVINKSSVIFWDLESSNSDKIKLINDLIRNSDMYEDFVNQKKFETNAADYVFDKFQQLRKKISEIAKD